MSKIKTGGPAFPTGDMVERDEKGVLQGYPISSAGMTLRDYFAARAMHALLSNDALRVAVFERACENEATLSSIAARTAYTVADEMLAARGGDHE